MAPLLGESGQPSASARAMASSVVHWRASLVQWTRRGTEIVRVL